MTRHTQHRDAGSGEYVSAEYAAAHPDSTVSETVREPEDDEITEAMVEAAFHRLEAQSVDWWDGGGYPSRAHVRAAIEAAFAARRAGR